MERLGFSVERYRDKEVREKRISKEELIIMGLIQKGLILNMLKKKLKELEEVEEMIKDFPEDKEIKEKYERLKKEIKSKVYIVRVSRGDTLWRICDRYYGVGEISVRVLIPRLGYKEKIIEGKELPIPLKKYMGYFIEKYGKDKKDEKVNKKESKTRDKENVEDKNDIRIEVISIEDIEDIDRLDKDEAKIMYEKIKRDVIRDGLEIYGKYLIEYGMNLQFVKITGREKLQKNLTEAGKVILERAWEVSKKEDLVKIYRENRRYFKDNFMLDYWNKRLLEDYDRVMKTMLKAFDKKIDIEGEKVDMKDIKKQINDIRGEILRQIRWVDEHDDGMIIRSSWVHEADMHEITLEHIIEDTDLIPVKALKWIGEIETINKENIKEKISRILTDKEIPIELRKDMKEIIKESVENINKKKRNKEEIESLLERMKIRLKEEIVNYYLDKLPEKEKERLRKEDKVIDIYMDINGIGRYDISDEVEDDSKYWLEELSIQTAMMTPAIKIGSIPARIATRFIERPMIRRGVDYILSTVGFTEVYNAEEVLREENVYDRRSFLERYLEKVKDWKTLGKNFILLGGMKYLKERGVVEKVERVTPEMLRKRFGKEGQIIGEVIGKIGGIGVESATAIVLMNGGTIIFDRKMVSEEDMIFAIGMVIVLRLEGRIEEGIKEIRWKDKVRFWYVGKDKGVDKQREEAKIVMKPKGRRSKGRVEEGGNNNLHGYVPEVRFGEVVKIRGGEKLIKKIIENLRSKGIDLGSEETREYVEGLVRRLVDKKFKEAEMRGYRVFEGYKEEVVKRLMKEYDILVKQVREVKEDKELRLEEKIKRLTERLERIDRLEYKEIIEKLRERIKLKNVEMGNIR